MIGFICILSIYWNGVYAQHSNIPLIVNTRGVDRTDISIIPLSGPNAYKSIIKETNIRPPATTTIPIPSDVLPGDFIIRFDYVEKPGDTPYPSERQVILYDKPVELYAHPVYINHPDSTYFSETEIVNRAWRTFSDETARRMKPLQVLSSFVHSYDESESELFSIARAEFFRRVSAFNDWLANQIRIQQSDFISAKMGFSFIPEVMPDGNEAHRMDHLIQHYFDLTDPSDPIMLRTKDMQDWINRYVNLYGQLSTTPEIRDSLFPLAGIRAIEWAKRGHPLVYGWMVDYFFDGYEKNGINAGMDILRPYLEDPNCMTRKKMEIQKRLDGIQKLQPGSFAPPIELKDAKGHFFNLYTDRVSPPYLLLFFWSADCDHCLDAIEDLYTWVNKEKTDITVIPIHIDDTPIAITKWKNTIVRYPAWRHFNAENGINGKEATAYYILSTPFYVLMDSKTHIIKGTPASLSELSALLKS